MSIWRFAGHLPDLPAEHRLTLGEGDTPLVRSRRIGPSLGLGHLHFKLENCNPTGSLKDRFAMMAVSDMAARGGEVGGEERIACLVTGIGFKDEKSLAAMVGDAPCPCLESPAKIDEFLPG